MGASGGATGLAGGAAIGTAVGSLGTSSDVGFLIIYIIGISFFLNAEEPKGVSCFGFGWIEHLDIQDCCTSVFVLLWFLI